MGKTHEALENAEKEYEKRLQRISRESLRDEEVTRPLAGASNNTNMKGYEDLKTNLQIRDGSVKSILFIDTSRGGRSSTHALNFATDLAMDFKLKVLLVDLNLWALSPNEVLKIDDARGLSDLFTNSGKVTSRIMKVGPGNLYTVRWGGNYEGPVDLFESRHFSDFVKMMCERFDYVILAAPPVTSFSECRVLCAKVDGVALVLETGKSGRQVALRAKQQLGKTEDKLLGVILDRTRALHPLRARQQLGKTEDKLLGLVLSRMRALNPQVLMIACAVVAVCLVFTIGLFIGNSRLKPREDGAPANHSAVRIKIKNNANSRDQTVIHPERNNYAQTTMVQDVTVPRAPKEKLYPDPDTGAGGEKTYDIVKPESLPAETGKEEPTSRPDQALEKRDEAKPKQVRMVVVMKGDTLFKIIDRAYGKYDEGILKTVLRENPGINRVDQITEGQIIKLPSLVDNP
jgi:Mrp family chromosome partitioning ATPase/phage tail protein X